MAIAHEHNLNQPPPVSKPFGIRVRLRARDPFTRLVGADWQKLHWFATERERDAALADMAARHLIRAAATSRRSSTTKLRVPRRPERSADPAEQQVESLVATLAEARGHVDRPQERVEPTKVEPFTSAESKLTSLRRCQTLPSSTETPT
jgi:hypothetical protein